MFDFLGVVLLFAPLIAILWLANLGERLREHHVPHMAPVVVSYTFLIMLYLFLLLFGVVTLVGGATLRAQPELLQQFVVDGTNPLDQVDSWEWLTWGTLIPAIFGLVLLLRPVRQFCARFLPIDPGHPVHAVALSMSMMAFVSMAFTLAIGLGNLSAQLAQRAEETGQPSVPLGTLWTQAAMFVLTALIGVGWLSRRSFGEAMNRLGVVRPTLRQVLIGVGAAVVLAPLVILFEAGINALGLGVGQDVESLTEQLLGPLFASPIGIVSIGLAAAIGEESLFRGAAQPRFGLIVTSLLFAVVHNNYGLSAATLIVFGLGLFLGWLRIRYNTTTSMITHALYNSLLSTIAYLAAQYVLQQN